MPGRELPVDRSCEQRADAVQPESLVPRGLLVRRGAARAGSLTRLRDGGLLARASTAR